MAFLREDIGSTFADMWYRVADQRPRVSVHARFVRQRHGPTVSYVIDDPSGGHFYRLSESARFFLGLLDGNRTVDNAWEACLAQLGDDAPTQKECIELLSQMQLFGLLVGDQPIAADMIPERQARFKQQRLKQRTGNWMFFNIPLLNPEPVLRGLEPYLRVIWSRYGLAAWLLIVLAAIGVFITHTDRLDSAFNGILDPANLVWIGILFLFIRAVHEFGHAMACKAMGGRCTEIGVMLIAMLLPLPYCDASSSWKFPETWRRVVVGLGGMIVEIFFAAIATFIWAFAEPGLARALAFNTMLISGVSTVIFNANPLLRYDGYYILSDLAGSPNLAQRAKSIWQYWIHKKWFGVISSRPPYIRDSAEARLLFVYHACAVPYRLFITFSILAIISTQYLSLGLILAVFFGFVWFVWPVVKAAWFLLTSPQLMGRRSRSIGVTLAIIGPIVLVLCVIPLPASGTLPAVVESEGLSIVRPLSSGYINRIAVEPGSRVSKGDVLIKLENPSILADLRAARARIQRASATLDDSSIRGIAERRVAEAQYERTLAEAQEFEERARNLEVIAEIDGTFVAIGGSGHEMKNMIGRFLERGSVIAAVVPDDSFIVRAAVTDARAGAVLPVLSKQNASTEVRLRGEAWRTIPANVARVWPAGTRDIESAQLSTVTGGEIVADPQQGGRSLENFTLVDFTPESTDGLLPGRRAKVRVALEPSTILSRVSRRVQQFIDGRLN